MFAVVIVRSYERVDGLISYLVVSISLWSLSISSISKVPSVVIDICKLLGPRQVQGMQWCWENQRIHVMKYVKVFERDQRGCLMGKVDVLRLYWLVGRWYCSSCSGLPTVLLCGWHLSMWFRFRWTIVKYPIDRATKLFTNWEYGCWGKSVDQWWAPASSDCISDFSNIEVWRSPLPLLPSFLPTQPNPRN